MVVETANGYCIDFEFHKTNTTEEIILRNIQYAVNFRLEKKEYIKSYVISLADAKRSIKKAKIGPDLEIEIPFIFFKDYNGDEILKNIKNKIEKHINIDEYDLFNLILIPFMKHEKSDYEITKELIYLVNEMELKEEQQYQIKACQIILVDIFIPKNEKKKMIKVVNMGSEFLENYEKELIQNAEPRKNNPIHRTKPRSNQKTIKINSEKKHRHLYTNTSTTRNLQNIYQIITLNHQSYKRS